ncbi:suppressor of fused domain protein [Nocardia sp. NPDC127526]|uniref:suppressor of fused domain protein n=1 Tax=Nocardia sp. NPDC127526 TaxID=3345393 RepID=UPI003641F3B0
MGASPLLRGVFRDLRESWGLEDDGYVFEGGPGPIGRVDVFIFHPADDVPMTSFATIGMSAGELPTTPGPGNGGRAELRFACRGWLDRSVEEAIARQLANLAVYPWLTGNQVNWGHMIELDEDFPGFPGCDAIFVAGPLTPNGQDCIWIDDEPIRIMNVVPITDAERAHARRMRPGDFLEELMANVDIFTSREPWSG